MRFKLTLSYNRGDRILPINYQHPVSSAIYKIIAKGNGEYARFLHDEGYGKGFKLFTFSDIKCPFEIKKDRLLLKKDEASLQVCFHIPEAMESFIRGLFESEQIHIADRHSRTTFTVGSVESLPSLLTAHRDTEVMRLHLYPLSPVVVGTPNEKGHYDYLDPQEPNFIHSLLHNWREKIATCYGAATAAGALLLARVAATNKPFRSRLIWIKAGKPEETKIRGWINFELQVTAEKRFLELLLNSGAGLYNAQGMGCMDIKNDDR